MSDRRPHPVTPDRRYVMVGGRLWRATNPALAPARHERLVKDLMEARRAVKAAKRGVGDLAAARQAVEEAKVALGERGPPWWNDGAPDFNRHLARNTPYADWAASERAHHPDRRGSRSILQPQRMRSQWPRL